MPAIAHANFTIDLQTLFAVVVFLSAIGGLLLLFSWLQNRSVPALAFWGLGYLLGAAGTALTKLALHSKRQSRPSRISITLARNCEARRPSATR